MTAKDIACQLGLGERSVSRWLAAGAWTFAKQRRKRESPFDSLAAYVLKRWKEGERHGPREIKEMGDTGTLRSVYSHLETLKQVQVKTVIEYERIQKFSASTAIWLFIREQDALDDLEQEDLTAWLDAHPTLARAYQLIQDFLVMVHKREGHRLDAWLQQVKVSAIPELQSFAAGVQRDQAAVQAGLTRSTNNGMVEGFGTKVKLIKRQGDGRASFPLLRHRVLHAL